LGVKAGAAAVAGKRSFGLVLVGAAAGLLSDSEGMEIPSIDLKGREPLTTVQNWGLKQSYVSHNRLSIANVLYADAKNIALLV
jgi:hypothetical protein